MSRYNNAVPQILDGNGVPIVGAKKFFFEPGTTTKKTIYSDSALTIPALNPQISDGNGRFSNDIFLDGIYDEIQKDNSGTASGYDGVTIWGPKLVGDVASGEFSAWVSDSTYNIPDKVTGSNDISYESLTDANQGNDPISSPSNWAPITFVKAGVLDGVTEIKDSNSLTALLVTPTASAVNYPEITNAAINEDPKIEAQGTDPNINLELGGKGTGGVEFLSPIVDDSQNELLEFVSTASAVNNPRITNAATGNAAKIDASETNSDLDFPRNGTGNITVDSTPIYGLVILPTPVILATDTSTTATGNTPVDITSQTTGVAVKVILNIYFYGLYPASAGTSEILVGEGGETLTTLIHRAGFGAGSSPDQNNFSDSNQVTVNLESGEIFDYQILQTGTAPTSRTMKIYLAGYYI